MPTTIYILGNLQTFVAALTGIQMIFNPANNTDWAVGGALFGVGPMVTIGLLVSLLHISTKGVWTQKLSLHHVGILLGLYAAMFVPTTRVTVQDLYTGQSQIVDGIPDGVAYPAAIVSQLSYDAATQLGQAFQTVSATQPPTNIATGMAAPLRTMLQLRNMYMFFSKEQPGLARDEVLFVKQCVYPNATYNNWWQQIESSNNILNTYASFSYPSSAQANVPYDATLANSGAAITCTQGGTCYGSCGSMAVAIDAAFQKWLNNNQSSGLGCSNAAGMSTAANAESNTPTTDCNGAGSFGSILGSMGSNGMEYVSMIINSCINSVGMAAGPSVNAYPQVDGQSNDFCTITTNSISQAQVDNAGASNVFLSNMLPLMSILQFLFIALAPLAAFTMVMAAEQGVQTFVKYIMFGLWTQSWLPVAAIINDYSQNTVEHQFQVLAAAATAAAGSVGSAVTSALNSFPVMGAGQDALTTTSLPILIQQTMQVLSNADMMLAMTPIITMIVFTGSYFGMAQLAQGVGGEDNVGKNTGLTTPGVSAEEKAFGTSSPGNARGTFVSLDSTYNGIGASYSSLSSDAESAAIGKTATAQQAYARTQGEAASNTFGALASSGVDISAMTSSAESGSREVGEAFKHAQKFASDTKVGADEMFTLNAAYQAALKIPGMTQEGAWKAAMSSASGKVLSGLNGEEGASIKKAIQQGQVQGWANELTGSDAAKFVRTVNNQNGKGFDQKTQDKVDKSVSDTERAEASVQDAVADQKRVEETAQTASSMGGNGRLDQATIASYLSQNGGLGLTNAMAFASRANGTKGLDDFTQAREQLHALSPDLTGDQLNAAALAKAGMRDQATGFGMLGQIIGDMDKNPVAQEQALQEQAQAGILKEEHAVAQGRAATAPAARLAEAARVAADHSRKTGAAYKQPPKVVQTPAGTSARAFGEGNMHDVVSENAGKVQPPKGGWFDKTANDVAGNLGVQALNKVTPGQFLGLLVGGNAVTGTLEGLAANRAAKAAAGAARGRDGGGGGEPGGPADGPPGGGAPEAAAGEGASAEGAARAELEEAGGHALTAADQEALTAAKNVVIEAGEKFAAKTAVGTAAAGAVGATGIGAPIAGAIEVMNVAMNVDAAVDVAQSLTQLAETPGASQYVRSALEGQARSILKKIETAGGDTGAAGGRSAAPAPSI